MKAIKQVLLLGLVARLSLLGWGCWQDSQSGLINYTDVDYWVIKDASDNIMNSKNPFDRSTYRYTPFLALIILPFYKSILAMSKSNNNNAPINTVIAIVDSIWAKLIFITFDLLAGYLIYKILLNNNNNTTTSNRTTAAPITNRRASFISAVFWILNPFVMTISTRGNAESILVSLILSSLLFAMQGKIAFAGLVWGLSVHWKIVPLVLGPGILSYLWHNYAHISASSAAANNKNNSNINVNSTIPTTPQSLRLQQYSPKSPSSWLSSSRQSSSVQGTPTKTPTKNIRSLQLTPVPLSSMAATAASLSNSDEIINDDFDVLSPSLASLSPAKEYYTDATAAAAANSSEPLLQQPQEHKAKEVSKAMTKAFGRAHTQRKQDRQELLKRVGIIFFFCAFALVGLAVPSYISYRWFGGRSYLEEAWLYHIGRLDHRHNFSPYWFMIYSELGLNGGSINSDNSGNIISGTALTETTSTTTAVTTEIQTILQRGLQFIPQTLLILRLGFKAGHLSLETVSFLQLFLFVSLNRVITSQYFCWYLALLPLVFNGLQRGSLNTALLGSDVSGRLPHLLKTWSSKRISIIAPVFLLGGWVALQSLWLSEAYRLEFVADDPSSYRKIFYWSLGMLAFNVLIASTVLKAKFIVGSLKGGAALAATTTTTLPATAGSKASITRTRNFNGDALRVSASPLLGTPVKVK